jgi:hypothetical protein
MPTMKTMDMSEIKDGDMFAVSHMRMDEHTGALNESAGMTPFPQPGPRTTRQMPPPSQMMSRPPKRSKERYLCTLALKWSALQCRLLHSCTTPEMG